MVILCGPRLLLGGFRVVVGTCSWSPDTHGAVAPGRGGHLLPRWVLAQRSQHGKSIPGLGSATHLCGRCAAVGAQHLLVPHRAASPRSAFASP